MGRVQDLIATEKERRAEEEERSRPEPTPNERAMTELQALIAAERKRQEEFWLPCEIMLAGELVDLEIGHVLNVDDWVTLTRTHPVNLAADGPYQYDRTAVARDYPLDRIRLDGDSPDREMWNDVITVASDDDRTSIEAVMWWLHIGEPAKRTQELKAAARKA